MCVCVSVRVCSCRVSYRGGGGRKERVGWGVLNL